MGEEKIAPGPKLRAVLDTNVFVSALLFGGPPGRIIPLWQQGRIVLLISAGVLKEYLRVLAYPKFRLTEKEIKSLIEVEVLPFTEPIRTRTRLKVIRKDPSDDKFLELAVGGKANFIVSSDKHLLELAVCKGTGIISVAEFLKKMN